MMNPNVLRRNAAQAWVPASTAALLIEAADDLDRAKLALDAAPILDLDKPTGMPRGCWQ